MCKLLFKPKIGCSNAIYTLRFVLNFYNSTGSTVTLCALDIWKAFDRVDQSALHIKLIHRRVPICFIELTMRNVLYVCVEGNA